MAGLEIDFRFYDPDASPHRIKADYALGLKCTNHAWVAQAKEGVPGGNYVFVPGGAGMAINQLKTWFQT